MQFFMFRHARPRRILRITQDGCNCERTPKRTAAACHGYSVLLNTRQLNKVE